MKRFFRKTQSGPIGIIAAMSLFGTEPIEVNLKPDIRRKKLCAAPTLSELIEACGNRFGILERDKATGAWNCVSDIKGDGETVAEGSYAVAETPEEAVAILWLALNKQ